MNDMKIFISYRRADSTYLIGRLRDRLMEVFGAESVFRDLDDIPAGVDFSTVLEQETNSCNVMLVVIGPLWAGITDAQGHQRLFDPQDYTRLEVETGLRRLKQGEVAVFPLLVMNATMPSPRDLPESLSQLTFQNALSIRNDPDFNHDMERLIRDIQRSQGQVEPALAVQYFEPETVQIPAGLFWLGSLAGPGIPGYEIPQHPVQLPAYRIGKYPVTNAQYEEFVRQTGTLVAPGLGWNGQRAPVGSENFPVTAVTWFEALAYCQWLSEKTGRKYSLPTEAQWEKACRGGSQNLYPWGNEFDPARCNHGRPGLAPVEAYPAQAESGCFDLVGNLRQWTCTLWGEKRVAPDSPYTYPWKDDRRNDLTASRQVRRVVRGSSFKDEMALLRCSARSGQSPDDAGLPGFRHGFRVVLTV